MMSSVPPTEYFLCWLLVVVLCLCLIRLFARIGHKLSLFQRIRVIQSVIRENILRPLNSHRWLHRRRRHRISLLWRRRRISQRWNICLLLGRYGVLGAKGFSPRILFGFALGEMGISDLPLIPVAVPVVAVLLVVVEAVSYSGYSSSYSSYSLGAYDLLSLSSWRLLDDASCWCRLAVSSLLCCVSAELSLAGFPLEFRKLLFRGKGVFAAGGE